MPRESLYSEQEQPAKAAVILKTRGGRLSDQAQLAIPQLVASAVENLRPENVTVIDADSNTPLLRSRGGGAAASAAYDLDDELSKTLVRTLEPVVGASHVRASVHVEYDLSSSDNTEEIYDPKATTALTQQRTEENMGGAGPGGIPGTASNLPAGTAPAAAAAVNAAAAQETQSSHSESTTFAVSKSVRHTVSPAGRIKRIAAAVLLDDVVESSEKDGKKISTRRKHTEEELKQISQLAAAAIGLDTQRGDLLSLENLSFQELPVEVPAAPGRLDTARRVLVGWAGMLRYLGIAALFAIVYLLMLRPIKKELLGTLRALPGQIARPAREQYKAGASAPTLLSEVEVQMPAGVEDARRASTLKRQLAEKVKAEPAAASRLVQSWIRGEGAE
jgi:flagellar M-ring protein FliF